MNAAAQALQVNDDRPTFAHTRRAGRSFVRAVCQWIPV